MKLYVIGNGFDLYHGLNTRYSDFQKYLEANQSTLAETLNNYFLFENDESYLWKNFERDLATYDHEAFFKEHNHLDIHSDSFKPSEGFGLEDDITQETEDLVDSIRVEFYKWISSIDCSKIMGDSEINLFDLDINAKYLNFNYTPTLEEVYGVKMVKYIHNNVAEYGDYLILGHGEAELRKPRPDELDEDGNSNRTLFTDGFNASAFPFFALNKDTDSVIERHRNFFESLHDVEEVLIYGHSLGEVDLPYFREIARNCNTARWEINCHTEKDQRMAIEVIHKLGIGEDKVSYGGQ